MTGAERRIVAVLKAGGSIIRPHLSTRSYQLCDPARPRDAIWIRARTIDRMLDNDTLDCDHATAPIRLGPKANKEK